MAHTCTWRTFRKCEVAPAFFFLQTILAHFMPLGTVRGFDYYIDSLGRNMAKETHYVFQTSHVHRTHLLAGNWRGSKEMKGL